MSIITTSPQEQKDAQKGRVTSIIAHLVLILLLALPLISFKVPPPVNSGVLVSFGEPEQGRNDAAATPAEVEKQIEEVVEKPVEKVKPKPKPKRPKPKPVKNVLTDKQSKVNLQIQKQKEKEQRDAELQHQEEAAEAAEEAEAERQKQAEIAAAKRAIEAEKARKKAEADAFRKMSLGIGSGNGGADGDQGRPDGDPDGNALDGLGGGHGDIGGGLGNRGLLYRPDISYNSQTQGDVVVKVCVNSSGKVISAIYTQKGSTTADLGLRAEAIEAAKKYKFEKGNSDKQCGTIKIKFRVK